MISEATGAITRMTIPGMDSMVSPLWTPKETITEPSVAYTVALPSVDRPTNSFYLSFRSDLVRFNPDCFLATQIAIEGIL